MSETVAFYRDVLGFSVDQESEEWSTVYYRDVWLAFSPYPFFEDKPVLSGQLYFDAEDPDAYCE